MLVKIKDHDKTIYLEGIYNELVEYLMTFYDCNELGLFVDLAKYPLIVLCKMNQRNLSRIFENTFNGWVEDSNEADMIAEDLADHLYEFLNSDYFGF